MLSTFMLELQCLQCLWCALFLLRHSSRCILGLLALRDFLHCETYCIVGLSVLTPFRSSFPSSDLISSLFGFAVFTLQIWFLPLFTIWLFSFFTMWLLHSLDLTFFILHDVTSSLFRIDSFHSSRCDFLTLHDVTSSLFTMWLPHFTIWFCFIFFFLFLFEHTTAAPKRLLLFGKRI